MPGHSRARADEGRRVFRNAASLGAFLISPVQTMVLSRALGPTGYGHWWWTFGLLEAASILGAFGADLFVRREVSHLAHEGSKRELPAIVGSALAVVGLLGCLFATIQISLAPTLAASQHDPGLLPFLLLLACQPLLWNVTAVLVAALQSLDVLGPIALIRGVVIPVVQVGLLYVAWRAQLATVTTLILLVSVSVFALAIVTVIYARHVSLVRTLAHVIRPVHLRGAVRYGLALIVPSILFTAGGKLDVYVLGAHELPAVVGAYAGCLSAAAMLPATRALFDPIVQTQIGALHGADDPELRASLARMTRMCLLALAPPLVLLIGVGEPLLEALLGHPVAFAVTPLAILCVGQLVGSLAIAGWLIPMTRSGKVLALIAGSTLVVKLGLLLALVPRFGMIGAAIATATGTMIAQQGQVLFASRRLGYRPYAPSLIPPLVVTALAAVGGRALFVGLRRYLEDLPATVVAGGVSLLGLGILLALLLDPSERAALRKLLR